MLLQAMKWWYWVFNLPNLLKQTKLNFTLLKLKFLSKHEWINSRTSFIKYSSFNFHKDSFSRDSSTWITSLRLGPWVGWYSTSNPIKPIISTTNSPDFVNTFYSKTQTILYSVVSIKSIGNIMTWNGGSGELTTM